MAPFDTLYLANNNFFYVCLFLSGLCDENSIELD